MLIKLYNISYVKLENNSYRMRVSKFMFYQYIQFCNCLHITYKHLTTNHFKTVKIIGSHVYSIYLLLEASYINYIHYSTVEIMVRRIMLLHYAAYFS